MIDWEMKDYGEFDKQIPFPFYKEEDEDKKDLKTQSEDDKIG